MPFRTLSAPEGKGYNLLYRKGTTLLMMEENTEQVKNIEIVDVLEQIDTGALCLKYKVLRDVVL